MIDNMKKFLNINTILIGIVLVLGIAGVIYMNATGESGNYAIVTVSKTQETLRIPLSEDASYEIDGFYPTTLVVEDNAISFIDSQCPDHICEAFGPASKEYDIPACLPAGVVVQIEVND